MSPVLDTNVVVRYLTNDDPVLAERAARIIDSGQPLTFPAVAVAETAYVLRSDHYNVERSAIVDALIELVRRPTMRVDDLAREHVVEALLLCRPSGRVSFADALIWATARSHGDILYSFDEKLPTAPVTLRRDYPENGGSTA
jgi:predicted nucleic acid-binding protein